MDGPAIDLTVLGFALAAVLHAAFAAYLVRAGYARRGSEPARRVFLAAIAATAAWAALALVEPTSRHTAPAYLAAAMDIARYGLWFAFVLLLLKPAADRTRRGPRLMTAAAITVAAASALVLAYRMSIGHDDERGTRLAIGSSLALAVMGLVLVEQLFRNVGEDSRWGAKPVCLGLSLVFAFDLYLASAALPIGGVDPDAASIRGAVHLLALPLLFVASRRRADWIGKLRVSRSLVFHSATLLLVGGYLLFTSALGYYVRYFGGSWGRALQLGLLTAGLAGLTLLMLSGSMRSRLRVFVSKHFFSYRYDYREEWLRFTAMLSTSGSPQEVGDMVVRGLANMVECPAGSLWTRAANEGNFRQTTRWNLPVVDDREPVDSPFCEFLSQQGWVIDVDEFRSSPRRYGQLSLPTWLLASGNLWLVVPLLAGDELLGFVILARPRTPMELNWEVRDLLKTASRQAAAFLAQMHATEALLEARKFDAFNRMSAFVVHDLKNIVTQLSLMMKNAQRLHANPEFQQDMLLTVDSSLEKMRRLMLQLREGATPPGGTLGVELAPILRRLQVMAEGRGRSLQVECAENLATRGHDERMERVLGHLVHNALDATPPDGRVCVRAARVSGQIKVEVEDNGVGIGEEFVQNKLFRPFSSTKHNGMGIGLYESYQYMRELGGSIAVDSQPGRGTLVTLAMPLFEAHAGSDLQAAART